MHQLPSRSHLSCLAVCETRSFLLIPHCQEGADGRCALPIILFLWYPACWQNSRSNIWRQEFAVYFQFGVTELKDSMGYRETKKGLHRIGEISVTKQKTKKSKQQQQTPKKTQTKIQKSSQKQNKKKKGGEKKSNLEKRGLFTSICSSYTTFWDMYFDLLKEGNRGKPSGISTYSVFYYFAV